MAVVDRDVIPHRIIETVPSLVDVAKDYIRERITSGEFPPGTRLKERELAEETGISRIPIREAMRALESEGFVTIAPRRGAIVTELKPALLDEIFEVREALEVQECVLAVRKATDDEIARLLTTVEDSRIAAENRDKTAIDAANTAFHSVLLEMTHNAVLKSLLAPLKNRLNWILRQNDDGEAIWREHAAMAAAIAARDEEQIAILAREHVETSKELALRLLFGSAATESAAE